MKLYGYWRSSSSWRVRVALALKGLEYEHVPVHLLKDGGEQHRPDHLALNPAGQVPVLAFEQEEQTVYVSQSLVILDYLDATHPEPPLWPRDLWKRTKARECAEICNSGMQPFHNLSTLIEVERLGGTRVEWAQHFLPRGLRALEAIVEAFGGRYCIGDEVTGADVCLAPQLFAVRRFDVDLEPYPNLVRVDAALAEHPAFQAASPERQPDAPEPSRWA
jgi:maleylpyruvate isomerase